MIVFRSAKEIAENIGITGTYLKRVRNGTHRLNKKHYPKLIEFYKSKLEDIKKAIKIIEK
ncbi:MAG: hypothetical protein E6R13_01380 [Spirochaetes bacterium]|nr:MAG: hypothetical protein E6R13_01380 [Spirochaetota bacterium]